MNSITKKALLSLIVTVAIAQSLQAMNPDKQERYVEKQSSEEQRKKEAQQKLNFDPYEAGKIGNFNRAKELIKAGADINDRTHGKTIFGWSFAHQYSWDMIIWLVENDIAKEYYKKFLNSALVHSNIELVNTLIRKGITPDMDGGDDTFLIEMFHNAVILGSTELVDLFLKKNPDLINAENNLSDTALHKAVKYRKIEITQLLLNRGANIDAVNFSRQTPLYLAVLNQDFDMVKLLVNNNPLVIVHDGINPNSPIEYYLQHERNSRALVQQRTHAKVTGNEVPFSDTLIFFNNNK